MHTATPTELAQARALSTQRHATADSLPLNSSAWADAVRAAADVDGWISAAVYGPVRRSFAQVARASIPA